MKRACCVSLAVAATMVWVVGAWAVDGVIEINQASVKAAGGFPFKITKAGSYRLTGNLDVNDPAARSTPAKDTTAIEVLANDVYIDLNGFNILGPITCTGVPVTSCSALGTGHGVISSNFGTSVSNGSIRGMGASGLTLLLGSRAEKIFAMNNALNGIQAESVTNSTAYSNGNKGIIASTTNTCSSAQNLSSGIESNITTASYAFLNGSVGIQAQAALGCVASGNVGIQIATTVATGQNVCGAVPCP